MIFAKLPDGLRREVLELPASMTAAVVLQGNTGEWLLHSAYFNGSDALLTRDRLDDEWQDPARVLIYQIPERGSRDWRFRERREVAK